MRVFKHRERELSSPFETNSLPQLNPQSHLKSYELFSAVDPAVVTDLLNWFRDNDRNVYKTLLSSLAEQRKLRAAFLQKKPLTEQYAWIHKTIQIKACDDISIQLLQTYLLSAQQTMLGMFCDEMGIEQDGKGSVVGTLPQTLDAEKLDATVEKMLSIFDPKIFTLYLHCFNLQVNGGYPTLSQKLNTDARLKLA